MLDNNEIIKSTISLTQDLVRIPSESSEPIGTYGSPEQGIFEHLKKSCSNSGIVCFRQKVFPERCNFIAKFPKPGSPKVLFIAHMDTVSAKDMAKPFSAEISANKVWGRGACDDKGPLASVIAVLTGLKQQGVELRYDVCVAATVDEECTMSGAAMFSKQNPSGWDLCIGLEPTMLQVVSTHRGAYRCRILPASDKAFAVNEIMEDLKSIEESLSRVEHTRLGQSVMNVTEIKPDSVNTHRILVDIRILPELSPAKIHAQIIDVVGNRAKVIPLFAGRGIDSDPNNRMIRSFQTSVARQDVDASLQAVLFTTDCSQLHDRGPCVVWGPGNPKHAHQVDEHIEVDQLQKAVHILTDFLTP